MSTPLTIQQRRELVLRAIHLIENAEKDFRDVNADPASTENQRNWAKEACKAAENEFYWQWKNVKEILERGR